MAQATNTTVGEIVLGGDLAGGDDGYYPELRASGVTPGSYVLVKSQTIDTKGRTVVITHATGEDVAAQLPIATTAARGVIRSNGGLLTLPVMTPIAKGIARIGANLSVSDGVVTPVFPTGTAGSKGLVQIGAALDVAGGVVSITNASASTKGGIIAGPGTFATNGNIGLNTATSSSKGIVSIGGNGLSVNAGVLSIATPTATAATKGLVSLGSGMATAAGVLALPLASTTAKGVVSSGAGVSIVDGVMSIAIADPTPTQPGAVVPGNGLDIAAGGVISLAPLPDATATTKGIVKPPEGLGDILSVSNGVLQLEYGIPNGSTTNKGFVQPGTNMVVSPTGVLARSGFTDATYTTKGLIRVGSGFNVNTGTLSATPQYATTTAKGIVQPGTTYGPSMEVVDGVLNIKNAEINGGTYRYGVVKIGPGISVTPQGVISIAEAPDASASVKGYVQPGAGFGITSGTLFANTATTTTKGTVAIGAGFMFEAPGVLAIDATAWQNATTDLRGIVQIGSGFDPALGDTGVLAVPFASTTQFGIARGTATNDYPYNANNRGGITTEYGGTLYVADVAFKSKANTWTYLNSGKTLTTTATNINGAGTFDSLFEILDLTLNANLVNGFKTKNAAPITTQHNGHTFWILLRQDATGGRTVTNWTLEGGWQIKWPDGIAPTLSTAPNTVDLIEITIINSVPYGKIIKGYTL